MPYPDSITDAQMAEIRRRMWEDDGRFVTDNPVGESVFDRTAIGSPAAAASQQLRLGGFTAKATQNINRIRVSTGTTAAGATPTLCRFGVYQRGAADLLTLVASTANDTALFAATNTTYTPSFTSPWLKVAGVDYMVGVLIVTAAAMPTFIGPNMGAPAVNYQTDFLAVQPRLLADLTGQADLPATIADASLVVSDRIPQFLLLQ